VTPNGDDETITLNNECIGLTGYIGPLTLTIVRSSESALVRKSDALSVTSNEIAVKDTRKIQTAWPICTNSAPLKTSTKITKD